MKIDRHVTLACSRLGAAVMIVAAAGLISCGEQAGDAADLKTGSSAASYQVCIDSPAYAAFSQSLCVCSALSLVGSVEVLRSPEFSVSVGVNGLLSTVATMNVEGKLNVGGRLDSSADMRVAEDLRAAGGMEWVGQLQVGGDLAVGGDLQGVGDISVAGAVRVLGEYETVGTEQLGNLAAYTPESAPPCDCDSQWLSPASVVGAAKMDLEVQQIGARHVLGRTEVTLGTGRYFLEDISSVGETTLNIDGAVAIYVEDMSVSVGVATIRFAPGATLDLFVAGDMASVGTLTTANDDPGALRLYVGGDQPVRVAMVGDLAFVGSIYAPNADLEFVGDTRVHGAVFAGSLDGVGDFSMQYARPGSASGSECTDVIPEEDPYFDEAAM